MRCTLVATWSLIGIVLATHTANTEFVTHRSCPYINNNQEHVASDQEQLLINFAKIQRSFEQLHLIMHTKEQEFIDHMRTLHALVQLLLEQCTHQTALYVSFAHELSSLASIAPV